MTEGESSANILIVDDSPICRGLVKNAVHQGGMTSIEAVDGFDGLAQLGHHRFDAIVLDNEMPKMNGVMFLKALRSDKRWLSIPVLMLTTTVSKPVILEAARLGLSGYLLKTRLAVPDLIARLRQAVLKPATLPTSIAPAPLPSKPKPPTLDQLHVPNLVPRETALSAIALINEAKTLAGIISQINDATSSAKASMSEVAGIVKLDPMLTTRILQRATSAAFGGTKSRVRNIEEAVRTIGVEEVRSIAATMAVFDAFPKDKPFGTDLLRCWQHALAVASIMNRIVLKTDAVPSGLPYMIGLCHDLGEILLRQKFPAEFAAAEDYARQAELPLVDLVKFVFGVPYSELMENLLERLKLPATMTAPIKEYHFASPDQSAEHISSVARALMIANSLAHSVLCTSSPECLVVPVLEVDCRTALIPTAAVNLAEIRSESITSTCMLAKLGPDDEAALMKPQLPRREMNVWYCRHRSISPLDPIESALRTLAKVDVHDRLPEQAELATIAAIVIVTSGKGAAPPARVHPQTRQPIPVLSLLLPDRISESDDHHSDTPRAILMRSLSEFLTSVAVANCERKLA